MANLPRDLCHLSQETQRPIAHLDVIVPTIHATDPLDCVRLGKQLVVYRGVKIVPMPASLCYVIPEGSLTESTLVDFAVPLGHGWIYRRCAGSGM